MPNPMHIDPTYTRLKNPDTGEEIGRLGYECGSHCLVLTVGHAHSQEHHCPCKDCHNEDPNVISADEIRRRLGMDIP